MRSKVQTLDPADVGDTASHGVCSEFYESLYTYHYLKRPHEIIPDLAAAMPDVSTDGTVYRIPIKQGVYFHDDRCFPDGKGRLLTAHDFVYAFKRIANVKVQSKSWYIFDGRVVGLDAFREYSKDCAKGEVDYGRPVEGLVAEDDLTLVIKLNRPWPQLIYWLAFLPTAPMAKEAVDYYKDDIVKHPVGTGPYILQQWHRGIYIEAVHNSNYREVFYPSEGMAED
ncbi:MAG: ABC transporter substrate-binding protein, partial [Planctomycetota bacterium]